LRNGQPRVVILRALKLGDFLTAVPSLRALTDFFPDHLKVLAAPSSLSPLVAHTSTAGVVAGTPGLVPLPQWLDRPDVAVDLHGFGPESQRLLTALRPRRFVAFHHPAVPQSEGGPRWDLEEHERHTRRPPQDRHQGPDLRKVPVDRGRDDHPSRSGERREALAS
jgi:hypothetical protein